MPPDFQSLISEGHRTRTAGDPAHSRAIFIDAVRKAAEERDEPSLAEALCGLARAEQDIGNLEASLHHYTNAAMLYRRIGPPLRLAYTLRHQANVLLKANQPTSAEPLYLEAETIYREAGDTHALDLANTLRGLAQTRQALASQDLARPLWQQARDLYAKLNIQPGVEECDRQLASPTL